MRWPWQRKGSGDLLVVSWSGQALAYVLARERPGNVFEVLKLGVKRQGNDSTEDFVHRLQALGLKGFETRIMLRPEQYQLLQIDAPVVPPEELRSAARYQIREMINSHVVDVTLDVMRVGDGQQKGQGHLFVVVATNALVRSMLDLGNAMHWAVSVIDIQETAQRNLQTALTVPDGQMQRANATLVLVDGQEAVLTISANSELFYSRSFDLPEGFLTGTWYRSDAPDAAIDSAFAPVNEYVPDYSVRGVSHGNDYSDTHSGALSTTSNGGPDDEKAQRFLVEVQRSLDVWDRSWSSIPLNGLHIYAGERSEELARWLAGQLAQKVVAMDVKTLFPGMEHAAPSDQALCLPLLGVLMRTESRKL
jgi:MSHA biogenesis protein MshI